MSNQYRQNEVVHNPKTNETKTIFIALGKTFVATDGSVNLISDFVVNEDITEGDSDGTVD